MLVTMKETVFADEVLPVIIDYIIHSFKYKTGSGRWARGVMGVGGGRGRPTLNVPNM
jgi:hypothetical protein